MMVRICFLPEMEVSHSVTKSMAILSNGHSGISVICKGYDCTLVLSLWHSVQYAFPDVLIHAFPVIFIFYEAVCMSSSLVTKFVMCFHEHCVFACFWYDRTKNFWFESMTCLYSKPLMCRKRSASYFGDFLSSVTSFGMVYDVSVTLVISGVIASVLGCRVRSSVMLHCAVLLLVCNVGPSWLVVESI